MSAHPDPRPDASASGFFTQPRAVWAVAARAGHAHRPATHALT
jgi:hypothetical protein